MSEKSIGNPKKGPLTNVKSPSSLVTLKYNGSFCNNLVQKSKIFSVIDDPSFSDSRVNDLVYDVSKIPGQDSELLNNIINLLLQLRAAQSDQNVFVQNNTVVREQILNQLKSEILKVNNRLTKKEIKELEVISSNSFDQKSLTDILKSLLERSKKKSSLSEGLGENTSQIYRNQGRISDGILSRYNRAINETSYNTRVFDRVLNHLSFNKLIHRIQPDTDSEPLEDSSSSDVYKKSKKKPSKQILSKKSIVKSTKDIENLNEQYGEELINKSDLILSVIKSQVKLSEINVLSKTKEFVRKIISKNVSGIISAETELINKSIVREQVKEIREDILRHQEQNDYYRSKHQNEIRRINSELKRFQNLKIITNSKKFESKASEFIDLNTQNIIKKNIIKLSSGKSVLHKFETIGENAISNYINKKAVYKDKFINKLFENYNYDYSKKVYRDNVNLRNRFINIDDGSVRDIHQENVLVNHINRKYINRQNIHDESTSLTDENINKYRVTKKHLTSNIKKSKKYNVIDEQIDKIDNKRLNTIVEKVVSTNYQNKLNEFINFLKTEKVNKYKTLIRSENIDRNLIFNVSQREVLKKIHDKHENIKVALENTVTKYDKYLDNVNLVRKIDTSKIQNKIHTNYITNSLRNISNIKLENTSVLNYKKLPDKLSYIHKLGKQNVKQEDRFIPPQNKLYYFDEPLFDPYDDKSHMVYKQPPKILEKQEQKKEEKKQKVKSEQQPDIVFEDRPAQTQAVDAKKIEQKIMSRTLDRNQIEDLIRSYMKNIDVGSISRTVMSGIERKIAMDRKRRGIF